MLAVRLANLQCVKCLLAAKCNATYEHAGWSSKSSKGQNNQETLWVYLVWLYQWWSHADWSELCFWISLPLTCWLILFCLPSPSCAGSCLYRRRGYPDCHHWGTRLTATCAACNACTKAAAAFARRARLLHRDEVGIHVVGAAHVPPLSQRYV